MAGGGVGEAALMGAVLGGGMSAMRGDDPLRGAMLGGALGAGGGALFGGEAAAGAGAVDAAIPAAGSQQAMLEAQTAGMFGTPTQSQMLAAQTAGMQLPPPTGIAGMLPQSTAGKIALGGGLGLAGLMSADRQRYGIPGTEKYSGPLSKFQYDPRYYQPDVVQPPRPLYQAQYANGGTVEQMSNANAIGQNTGFPQANIHQGAYATPWQSPVSQNMLEGAADTGVNPITGEMSFGDGGGITGLMTYAKGGIADLGSYSDGGRMLKGPGDGMSDSIPASISGKQPARLADGEFVVPADVVSHLGNGSTDAGARQLYNMMDKVRKARTGRKSQGKEINPKKYMPA